MTPINSFSAVSGNNREDKCPYLGLAQDPETSLSYMSSWNVCYHARPVASPNLDYQQSFCFSGQHSYCPVYARSTPVPLPVGMRLPENHPTFEKGVVLPILLGCVGLILCGLGVFWMIQDHYNRGSGLSGKPGSSIASATTSPLATDAFPFMDTPGTLTGKTASPRTPSITFSLTPTPTPTRSPNSNPRPTSRPTGTPVPPINTAVPPAATGVPTAPTEY